MGIELRAWGYDNPSFQKLVAFIHEPTVGKSEPNFMRLIDLVEQEGEYTSAQKGLGNDLKTRLQFSSIEKVAEFVKSNLEQLKTAAGNPANARLKECFPVFKPLLGDESCQGAIHLQNLVDFGQFTKGLIPEQYFVIEMQGQPRLVQYTQANTQNYLQGKPMGQPMV